MPRLHLNLHRVCCRPPSSSFSARLPPVFARALFHSTLSSHSPPSTSTSSPTPTSAGTVAPQVIFSAIQPTGAPHLGNYLGALRQWVKLQNEALPETTLLYSVADLHAITLRQDPSILREWRKQMLASLIAVGLDPKRSIIFHQSAIPAHSELHWILSCNASMGYLSRMTQWKSKMALPENANPLDTSSKAKLKLGLFSYPVLQAADILIHRATHVPVGADQTQHLEYAREVASGFNHLHTPILTLPSTILSPAKRIMSLTQPLKKMSKSDPDPKSRILITDTHATIKRKIKSALTDSIEGITYDPVTRPGVSNLIEMMYCMDESVAESPVLLANELKDLSMRALKEKVADTIELHIRDVRERYESIVFGDAKVLMDINEEGVRKAKQSADATLKLVREAIGLD
ncbi:tryptophan-tRNA ligase [Delitschia confertaspora ATCC 74209]|uniref:Tryptophan--tRNA ligase, mitochondrial n=1 Tax=Delitschia confertaspora ATCC 74209 TaxID=1513339 RepID=A0A9P4N3A2_9PLEO|nr:tryptophan-tRNA ligase [Delitschia confertaspora ATCC 74209]